MSFPCFVSAPAKGTHVLSGIFTLSQHHQIKPLILDHAKSKGFIITNVFCLVYFCILYIVYSILCIINILLLDIILCFGEIYQNFQAINVDEQNPTKHIYIYKSKNMLLF